MMFLGNFTLNNAADSLLVRLLNMAIYSTGVQADMGTMECLKHKVIAGSNAIPSQLSSLQFQCLAHDALFICLTINLTKASGTALLIIA